VASQPSKGKKLKKAPTYGPAPQPGRIAQIPVPVPTREWRNHCDLCRVLTHKWFEDPTTGKLEIREKTLETKRVRFRCLRCGSETVQYLCEGGPKSCFETYAGEPGDFLGPVAYISSCATCAKKSLAV
jgi:hypothetical protein